MKTKKEERCVRKVNLYTTNRDTVVCAPEAIQATNAILAQNILYKSANGSET